MPSVWPQSPLSARGLLRSALVTLCLTLYATCPLAQSLEPPNDPPTTALAPVDPPASVTPATTSDPADPPQPSRTYASPPQSEEGPEEVVRPAPPFWSSAGVTLAIERWFNGLNGLEMTFSMSTAMVTASAGEGGFTKGLVAQGSADTRGLSLSLYRHPEQGWSWSTDGSASYLSSVIRDFDTPQLEQPMREGVRYVRVQCQPFNIDGELFGEFQSCDLSNRYQLNLLSASYGLWGGYYKPLQITDALKGHLKFGLSWHPLNLRWVRASLGGYAVSDELSWSWLGVVKGGALLRLFILKRLGLGLSFDLEWTPSIPFDDTLEFRGARGCDTQSCQRERVFVDHLSILSPSLGVHLLWLWSV